MAGTRQLATWLLIATVAGLYVCVPMSSVLGQPHRVRRSTSVAIGETASTVAVRGAERRFRRALAEELGSLGGVRLASTREAQYVLRGSVTRLESRARDQGIEVRCEVTLLVAERRGGAVRLMLSGRAGARGGTNATTVQDAALAAAVRGALRPLPSGLRGRRK